jgi:hypothetical protein
MPITTNVVCSNPAPGEVFGNFAITLINGTTSYDKVCQWLATGRLFSPVSSTNKTDYHDIAQILLKVALNTTTLTTISDISKNREPLKIIL